MNTKVSFRMRVCFSWWAMLLMLLGGCVNYSIEDACISKQKPVVKRVRDYALSDACRLRHCHRVAAQLLHYGVSLSQEGQHIRVIIPSHLLFLPKTIRCYQGEANPVLKALEALLHCYEVHTVRVASCMNFSGEGKDARVFAAQKAERVVQCLSKKRVIARVMYAEASCPFGHGKGEGSIELWFDYDVLGQKHGER